MNILNREDPAGKIDDLAVDGLSGVSNSLAYKVHEIQRHHHSYEEWFGVAATPSGETHTTDQISENPSAFQIDAGNDDWGTWTQVLGSSNTPVRSGMARYDPHEIIITDTERASVYFLELAWGDDGSTGYAAGDYTEFVFNATVQKETAIMALNAEPQAAGEKMWARCLSKGDDTGTFDFYIGLHEYEG